jgi:cysteine desulfurase
MKTYLDFASTTPIDPDVVDKMYSFMSNESFGNPSSLDHEFGISANEYIKQSRKKIAKLINANLDEIIWTSGATESNNMAIVGFHKFQYKGEPMTFLTSNAEHTSVIECMQSIKDQGSNVIFLSPDKTGSLNIEQLFNQVNSNVSFISCMHVNNETGAINDIEAIGKYCREHGIIFHVDAAQSVGKIPIDIQEMNIDLMSLSAHKVYGPKGVGALFINKETVGRVKSIIVGGGQERGMRSGTLPTHQIVGMAKAYKISEERMTKDFDHLSACRTLFLSHLSEVDGWRVNGSLEKSFPGILSICIEDLYSESLIYAMRNFAISRGSACSSDHDEPSHVLKSMGLSDNEINGTIRISFGRYTTFKDVESAASELKNAVIHLRKIKGSLI